jgi:hypothetical protein
MMVMVMMMMMTTTAMMMMMIMMTMMPDPGSLYCRLEADRAAVSAELTGQVLSRDRSIQQLSASNASLLRDLEALRYNHSVIVRHTDMPGLLDTLKFGATYSHVTPGYRSVARVSHDLWWVSRHVCVAGVV